jgi:hypothetical protein
MKHAPRINYGFDKRPIVRVFEKNREYYYAHKAELLRRYRNKYVAICNEDIVDVDKDRTELLKRLRVIAAYKGAFVTQVTERPRVVYVPSYGLIERRKKSG